MTPRSSLVPGAAKKGRAFFASPLPKHSMTATSPPVLRRRRASAEVTSKRPKDSPRILDAQLPLHRSPLGLMDKASDF